MCRAERGYSTRSSFYLWWYERVLIRKALEKRYVWRGVLEDEVGRKPFHKGRAVWNGTEVLGSPRGFSTTEEWVGLLGTSWGWIFYAIKELGIFPAAVRSRWRHKTGEQCGGFWGVRGTALTSTGECGAIRMPPGWDVVIWGWGREQSPESSSGWVIMVLTSLEKWPREQIWGKR